jgi:hypothetical protein
MRQSSIPLSWVKKHKFGFLAQMSQQHESLLLVKGGYWTLSSLAGWYTDVDVVAEAEKQGYLARLRTSPVDSLDGRCVTSRGEAFASDLLHKMPPATRARPSSKKAAAVSQASAPPASEPVESIGPPVLTSKALELLRRVEAQILADPNCFTLRACCESIPESKTKASPEKYPQSGVIGCLAGVTCLCIAKEQGADTTRLFKRPHSELTAIAANELGLSGTQGCRLFGHLSFDFLKLYRNSKSAYERALMIHERIERFIETGE